MSVKTKVTVYATAGDFYILIIIKTIFLTFELILIKQFMSF